jgi:adenylate cyclase
VPDRRRLAAIMFTDTVGSTASAQVDEAAALRLRKEQEGLVRPLFAAYRGREVKSLGDGYLVEFESALDAVQCAVQIQQTLHARNQSHSAAAWIQVRIGVHLGDVVHTGGDVFGDSVNVASRIEALALPEGVCLSEPVFGQVRNKIPQAFERLEPTALKGVQFPLDLYRVVLPWEVAPGLPNEVSITRLAVLPFVNMSPDANDEYFADGMTEELIGQLSEVPGLKVIARTSVMSYKRKEKRLAEIGRELRVGSIIEGSVRRSGNRIRVTVQLVDARSEEHLWASKYDQGLDDIFAIQSDVAAKVAGSLERGVFAKTTRKDTTDLEAYTSYLRALQLLHEDTEPSLREAVRLLERAVGRDPNFARAYAGLARAYDARVMDGCVDWAVVLDKAEPAARKSLELGPDWAETHAALAEVHGLLDRFEASIGEAERAIEINPNLSEAYETLGRQQATLRGLEKSLAALRRAVELDPLAVRTALLLAWVAQLAGHEPEALGVLERTDRLSPKDPRVYDGLAEYHRLRGEFATARDVIESALGFAPDDTALRIDRGVLFAVTGERRQAEQVLEEMGAVSNDTGRLNARLFIRAALGDLDEAFGALDALAENHSWPFLIEVHPTFEAMRRDPRFAAFCARVGLPIQG